MEEKLQHEEGLNLMDIVRLLLSKIKLLILVVFIGGLLGGSFAIWRTYDVNYYGTEVQFYVNPDKPKASSEGGSQFGVYGAYGRHVMDNMVKLLSSESFTEHLILETKPLPNVKDVSKGQSWKKSVVGGEKDITADLNALIEEAKTAIEVDLPQAYKDAKDYQKIEEDTLTALQNTWASTIPTLDLPFALSPSYFTFSDYLYSVLEEFIPDNSQLKQDYAAYTLAKEEAAKKSEAAIAMEHITEEKTEKALEMWRTTTEYKRDLAKYSGQISYSYLGESDNADDANNLARSFIYVKISVLNDDSFAKTLHQKVIKVVPSYVEQHMAIPDGYEGTNCQRITRSDEIHLTNLHYTTNQAIKFGLLFAVAAAVVTCVVIIINDRSDKRLRDQETITRLFNVPVLGIVPTIDDLAEQSNLKKKTAYVHPILKEKSETPIVEETEEIAVTAPVESEPEAVEQNQANEATTTPAPKKRRDTSNSPSNKKKRAQKSNSEVK